MESKIVVIEGLDGSGKTTQSKLLFEKIKNKLNLCVNFTSFPNYKSPSSMLARMYLNGEFGKSPSDVNVYAATSFYAVDRYADFKKNWEKKYQNGEIFVLDRYTTANYYQLAKLPKERWEDFYKWYYDYEYNKLGLPKPTKVIFLKVPIEISQKLMRVRYSGDDSKRDVHEANISFLKKCEEAADYISKRENWACINCLDNQGNLKNTQTINREILERLKLDTSY